MANQVRVGVGVTGAKGASSELDRLRDKFDKLQKTSGKGLAIGAGAGLALGAVNALSGGVQLATQAVFDSVAAASDLNETLSKSSVVFGDASDQVAEWGDTTAKALGLSKNDAVGAAATFGNLFNQIGVGTDKVASMSERLVTLAGDLASFNNIDPGEALEKLRSGLAGESEPLRSVGVFLTEAKVKAKAMELGLGDAHGELSEGAKILARYQLILDETKSAQGDFGRTSDQMANQQRILNAELEDSSAKFGNKLVPAVIGGQRAMLGFLSTLDLVQSGLAKTTTAQQDQAQGLIDLERAVAFLIPAAGSMADAQQDLLDKAKAVTQATTDSTNRIVGDFDRMGSSVPAAIGKVSDAAVDWRDKYRDVSGDIIRRSHRVRDALIKDAAAVRGEVFDETEIRADLHNTRLSLFAAEEQKRDAKTAEEKRQASDDIVQALDDEGQGLEDLAGQGKLTQTDVDRFTKDAKRNMGSLSKEGRADLQRLIDKYTALANMPNIHKTFSINEVVTRDKGSTRDTHGKGHGQLEYDQGGIVPGPVGTPREATVHGGEMVLTTAMQRALLSGNSGGSGGGNEFYTFNIYPQGRWDVDNNGVVDAVKRLKAISKKRVTATP